MSLPYDPHQEEAVAIAPLFESAEAQAYTGYWHVAECTECGRPLKLNAATIKFIAKHEVPAVCPECAAKFSEGEI